MTDEQPPQGLKKGRKPASALAGWIVMAAIMLGIILYVADMVVTALQPVMPEPPKVQVTVTPPPAAPVAAPAIVIPPAQYAESIGPQWEEKGPPAPPPKPSVKRETYTGIAHVALVIDDCGMSTGQTLPALDLPHEATLSFLPWGRATPSLAAKAKAEGFDVLLHMPMQPKGNADPGVGAIVPGQTAEEITKRLEAGIAAVPQAIGMNNHMGSAATSDTPTMQAVMADLKTHPNLFFLDSYTDAHSVAYKTALAAGIRTVRRDVFLDDDLSRAAVDIQLERLVKIAHKQGTAIAIGHPHPNTLAALKEFLAKRSENGIELVRLKTLVEEPQ